MVCSSSRCCCWVLGTIILSWSGILITTLISVVANTILRVHTDKQCCSSSSCFSSCSCSYSCDSCR